MATGGITLNGSTQYLNFANKVVSGFPFTFVCWVAQTSAGSSQFVINQQQSSADRYAGAFLDANGTDKYASLRNPGNSDSATKAAAPHPSAALQLMVVVFASTTSRTCYFGNNTGVASTLAMTDDITNHDRLTIGAWHYNGGAAGLFLNGTVAEAHFFNTALTSSDVTTLLTTPPEDVAGWVDGWKLASNTDLTSIGGSRTLTAISSPTTGSVTLPYTRASAPTLTSPTGAATGNGRASGTVSTTGTDGTLYAVRSAAQPTNTQIVAGQDSTGASTANGSLAITTSGSKTIPLTSGPVIPVGSQNIWFLHRPTAGSSLDSSVPSATYTQPATLGWSGTYPNQTGVAGAAFVHAGSIPTPTAGVGTKTYSATGLGASGLTVNTATGQLQGTCGTAGAYNITPTVTDSSTPNPQTAELAAFTLTITGGGGGGDTTPPTMSLASVTGGTLAATGSITSNETGALWWKMDASATATDPGAGSETGAGWTSQSMLAAANAVDFSTQPAGLRYGHFIGVDAAGNRAAVVNASGTVTAGAGTYSAQTDIIAVAGIPLANALVYFSWAPNGRPGSITSPVNASTTTDSTGRATISHTVAGDGFAIIGTRPGPLVSNDRVFAQFLTLA